MTTSPIEFRWLRNGTELSNDVGLTPLNLVMKLVECNGLPVAKLSDDPGKTMCKNETFLAYLRQTFELAAKNGTTYHADIYDRTTESNHWRHYRQPGFDPQAAHKARRDNSRLVIFAELNLCGYYPQDLLDQEAFRAKLRKGRRICAPSRANFPSSLRGGSTDGESRPGEVSPTTACSPFETA